MHESLLMIIPPSTPPFMPHCAYRSSPKGLHPCRLREDVHGAVAEAEPAALRRHGQHLQLAGAALQKSLQADPQHRLHLLLRKR